MMDPISEISLETAILFFARQSSTADRETIEFAFCMTGQDPNRDIKVAEEVQKAMVKFELLKAGEKGSLSLTDSGTDRLKELEDRIAESTKTLGAKISEALKGPAGKEQAAMFRDRLGSLGDLMDKLEETIESKAAVESAQAVLAFRLPEVLDSAENSRTYNTGNFLDLLYTRLALVKSKAEYQDAPKKPNNKWINWEKIDRGLFYGRLVMTLRTGPILINLLRISPKGRSISAVDCSGLPANKRSLASLCDQHGALAGTSGGFCLYPEADIEPPSQRGDPVGLLVSEQVVVHPPVYSRSALMIDDEGHVHIRRIGMKGVVVRIGGLSFPIKKVNATINRGEVGLFTRAFGRDVPEKGALFLSVVGKAVVAVSETPVPIPLNGFCLAIDPAGVPLGPFSKIEIGEPVDYELPSMKGVGKIVTAMAGGPALLNGGRVDLDFSAEQLGLGLPPAPFNEDLSVSRALLPRMAWGITEQKELIAVAVDGRNLERSVGMSLDRLARFMLSLGCVDALNLDGGSTKRMVVQGHEVDISTTTIVTEPGSRAPKRPLSSALLIR